jgi:hypothetical protein
MDLLKYLEPMKNLPKSFSNLAFWRGVRKLRDEVVNAFEYVDSWGESIESEIKPKMVTQVLNTRSPNSNPATDLFEFKVDYSVGNTRIFTFDRVGGTFPEFPKNVLPFVTIYLPYSYIKDVGTESTSGTLPILGRFVFDSTGNVINIAAVGNATLTLTNTELSKIKNDFTSVLGQVRNSNCVIEFTRF